MEKDPFSEIRDHARRPHGRPATGFLARLSQEQRDELLAIKREWRAREYGAISGCEMARIIRSKCLAAGIEVCGEQGLRRWLSMAD